MDGKNNLVSVLITAYNREKYIGEAIGSVLDSTYKNLDIIVVDDFSSDKTVNIASKFAKTDHRIRIFQNKENLGQFRNRNKAASLAKGSILFWLDSDDTIEPKAIETILEEFLRFPQAKFATLYLGKDIKEATLLKSKDAVRKNFLEREFLIVGPSGTVITKELFNQIGGFPMYGPISDTCYNVLAAYNSDVILLPYIFFRYRQHGEQIIHSESRFDFLVNKFKIFEYLIGLPGMPFTNDEKALLIAQKKSSFLLYCLIYLKETKKIKDTISLIKIMRIRHRDMYLMLFRRRSLGRLWT